MQRFKMKSIRVDKQAVDTYTDEELRTLLRKPDTKTCRYVECQCWVMTNLLFSTGIRQRSMMNLTIRDVDLDNQMPNVRVTKNITMFNFIGMQRFSWNVPRQKASMRNMSANGLTKVS